MLKLSAGLHPHWQPTYYRRMRTPQEKYMLWSRGFGNGASMRAIAFPNDPIYMDGYRAGREARSKAVDDYCKSIGYTPTVLRTSEVVTDQHE